MTEPLTPRDADLRDFPRMMIDITRLRQSGFDATINDSAWRAGINLWFSAWHSVPAGSLASTDADLAKAAGLGRDVRTWLEVKEEALRGFVQCSDGRLYHETVCEFALEAWIEKLIQRISSGAGNATRWRIEFDPAPFEEAISEAATLLAKLNPSSKTLVKIRRKRPAGNPGGTKAASRSDQETLPLGQNNPPAGNPDDAENDRKRQGQGQGQRDISQQQPLDSPRPPIADDVDAETMDLLGITNRICRLAGVAIISNSKRIAALDTVKAWLADGISVDETILPTIEAQRLNTKETSIGSLAFYAGRIAKAHADKVGTPAARSTWTPEAQAAYIARLQG